MGQSFSALAGVSLDRAETGAPPKSSDEALRRVSREFESVFLGELMKAMRSTTLDSGLFGNSRAQQMYREMYDEALAGRLAETGSIGIGGLMYGQLHGRV